MNQNNNNKLEWYKTSEIEPPEKTRVWVCQPIWFEGCKKQGQPSIRLDSWDPVKKSWRHHYSPENTYWTYPIYPDD